MAGCVSGKGRGKGRGREGGREEGRKKAHGKKAEANRTGHRSHKVVKLSDLKVIKLLIVQKSIVVHIADLEHALQGTDALGLQLNSEWENTDTRVSITQGRGLTTTMWYTTHSITKYNIGLIRRFLVPEYRKVWLIAHTAVERKIPNKHTFL